MYRVCKVCGEEKPIDFFSKDSKCKKGRTFQCKVCKNQEITKRRQDNKRRSVSYLGGACTACGGVYHPAVFDFHHRDISEKEYNPGELMGYSWDRVLSEIQKCVLLCANCHRMVHNEDN